MPKDLPAVKRAEAAADRAEQIANRLETHSNRALREIRQAQGAAQPLAGKPSKSVGVPSSYFQGSRQAEGLPAHWDARQIEKLGEFMVLLPVLEAVALLPEPPENPTPEQLAVYHESRLAALLEARLIVAEKLRKEL